MCSVDVYYKEHVSMHNDASSGGGRPIPSKSSTEPLFSLGYKIKFIGNLLQ